MRNTYAVNIREKQRDPIRTFIVNAGDAAEAKKKALDVIQRESPGKPVAAISVFLVGT